VPDRRLTWREEGDVPMSAFSDENIAKARTRIPATGSNILEAWVTRAEAEGRTAFAEECRRELELRGDVRLDAEQARQHAEWTEMVEGLTLQQAIEVAFREHPATPDEERTARWIHEKPGISVAELTKLRKKKDTGLMIGQFVNTRMGFFRPWLKDVEKKSGLLFERDETGGKMHYSLTPDAAAAFLAVGLSGGDAAETSV
jgi:hypothetical protein